MGPVFMSALAQLPAITCAFNQHELIAIWNGERNEVDIDTAQLAPLDSDRIGVHLAPDGTMELYVNRIKRGTIPLPEGATAPSADALYAVIDLVGQACLVQLVDSYPPEEETDEMRKAQVKRDLRRTFKS